MEKIGIALARLERVKELLKNWQQKKAVSNIERNIALNQLATLYDEVLDLGIAEGKPAEVILDKPEEPKQEEQVISSITTEATVIEKEHEPVVAVQTPPTSTLIKSVTENKDSQVKTAVRQEKQEEGGKEEQNKTVRLGDKFAGVQKYLYDNFEHQDDAGFARFSAIDDINRAIGINDRFLFIKELFNGDKDLFNQTIAMLNGYSCLDDALMYIHENFSWNSEDSAVKQLVLLLYRRFK